MFVVDRLKELIKISAYAVAPAELEAVLLTHPNVADHVDDPESLHVFTCILAVFDLAGRTGHLAVRVARDGPEDQRAEVSVAAVVPRGDPDADGLMDWVAEKVASHKKIRDVRFVDAIPKTLSGKLLRRVLVE